MYDCKMCTFAYSQDNHRNWLHQRSVDDEQGVHDKDVFKIATQAQGQPEYQRGECQEWVATSCPIHVQITGFVSPKRRYIKNYSNPLV